MVIMGLVYDWLLELKIPEKSVQPIINHPHNHYGWYRWYKSSSVMVGLWQAFITLDTLW